MLMDMFPKSASALNELSERTTLVSNRDDAASLRDLFQKADEVEVPIHGHVMEGTDELSSKDPDTSPHTFLDGCTPDCIASTAVGSVTFLLYHIVYCLAQASTITRPHATVPIIGPVAKMSALGILLASPVFIYQLGGDVPAIYPTSDLFLAPFLADLARTIDDVLYQDGMENDSEIFLATFAAVSGAGLLLSGVLCILAARVKLANLGAFLPYSVLCGFFTAVAILMWTLAFSVDTGGMKMGHVLTSGDMNLIGRCLMHHAPSFAVGATMHVVGPKNPFYALFLVLGTIVGAYVVMWVTGTTLTEAQDMQWFWTPADLINTPTSSSAGGISWDPPAPFGVINAIFHGKVHWGAFQSALPTACALAFLYLIRCSLHAAAVKKNIPNVTRKRDDTSASSLRLSSNGKAARPKSPVTLQKILERGYGYSQLMAGLSGGIAVAPAVGSSLTLFKLGAEGQSPQYGSVVVLLLVYLTDFQVVSFIPKPAFSCMLVLSFFDMTVTWLINSYKKTKQKWEWMVTPFIVVLTFMVGLLNAIFLGIAFSTFIFVASFYRTGVVKFLANGLTLRSTIERGYRESAWLDQNGDLIQILVLRNYLFFGNAQSVLSYINTMFEEAVEDGMQSTTLLPPYPRYIIIDFTIVSGMDTSAVDLLREIITLCENNQCRLFLAGLSTTLRSNMVYAGLKPDSKTFAFQPDLESSLGKAEDGLLTDVFHVVAREEHDAGMRRRARTMSNADDGFQYALHKIDEQHGLSMATELVGLERYTTVVELKPGQSLFKEEGGSLDESDRGFFFIEHGLMRVEKLFGASTTRGSGSTLRSPLGAGGSTPVLHSESSIGHLNARTPTLGREAAIWKQVRSNSRVVQNFRLARIGQGWVVGTIEGCSGMRNPGKHVAVTACRLHLVSYVRVKEIEKENPALILSLFRLVSHLSARRQELTIEQLAQFITIMNSPGHTSEPISRMSLAALQRSMVV